MSATDYTFCFLFFRCRKNFENCQKRNIIEDVAPLQTFPAAKIKNCPRINISRLHLVIADVLKNKNNKNEKKETKKSYTGTMNEILLNKEIVRPHAARLLVTQR